MKILFISSNFWPDATGNSTFVTQRCEYLASQGHDVTVCTGFPWYPQWRIRDEYRGKLYMREPYAGIQVVRSLLYVPRQVTSLGRIFHEASFICSSFLSALAQQKPDLIYIVSAPLGLAVSGFLLGRYWRVPYAFYVADMQPDAAADLGMLPGPIVKFLYALERFAYRNAALVPTLTEGMRQRIVSKGVPPEKVVVFSHCAEQALFDVPARGGGAAFRLANGLDGRFIVLHSGNMGVKQGLEVMIDAAARTRHDPSIVYILVGDGVAKAALQERTANLGLQNVRFLPVQPREMFREMLGAADICLITERASVGDILFPGKTVDFLAAGRAVIGSLSAGTEAGRILSEFGAGLVVPPEDPDALAAAVLRLRGNNAERALLGERGRAYARQHWDRNKILPFMEETLAGLCRQNKARKQAA